MSKGELNIANNGRTQVTLCPFFSLLRNELTMSLQQWCFSFQGRIGRRDFWIWMGSWLILMTGTFVFADRQWIEVKSAAFALVVLLWPTAAILVKRLHDRNKSAWWALCFILAWMLAAGNWDMIPPLWQWVVGRFLPAIIMLIMVIDCGVLTGSQGDNHFGREPEPVRFRSSNEPKKQRNSQY